MTLVSKNFSDIITFTRSSTATYVASSGLLTSAATNAPRFDYDPVTLAPKGLLVEEQRTNLLLNSLLNGTSLSTQSVTVSATAYTLSFYGTGSVALSGAYAGTLNGTGAYPSRATLTFTPTAGTLTLTVTGSVQYAQLEAGSFATSFIPTAGSQVTRTADVTVIQSPNFAPWFNASQGTFVINFDSFAVGPGYSALEVSDGTSSNRYLAQYNQGANARFLTFIGNSAVVSTFNFTPSASSKFAIAYAAANYNAAYNATVGTTNTYASVIAAPTQMKIGSNYDGSSGYLNGHIQSIKYYPTRLTDAQLQALTT